MRERMLAIGVGATMCIAAILEVRAGLEPFGIRSGSLHWPDVGRLAAGERRVGGEEVYEPLRAALANRADDCIGIVLADDANAWTWISYLTYPRTWRYASLRAASAVLPKLPAGRLRIVAELPGLDGSAGDALVGAFATSLRSVIGNRDIAAAWSSISRDRVLVVLEVAP